MPWTTVLELELLLAVNVELGLEVVLTEELVLDSIVVLLVGTAEPVLTLLSAPRMLSRFVDEVDVLPDV